MTEGEFWSEELLSELRAGGYKPPAWSRFFVRAFARAREQRTERPRAHHQVLALGAAGLVAWGLVAVVGQAWVALAGALWWILIALMLDWHLGMLEDPSGHRLHRLGPANMLSVVRAGVAPALIVASPTVLAALLVPAGITDVIDGRIARARREETRLGHRLDGGVDGLVLGAAAIGAAGAGVLPWWIAALVLGRHALQWLLVAAAFLVRAKAPPQNGFVSGKKPGLVLQAGLILAALHVPSAAVLVAAGALGGLATLGLTVVRSYPVEAAR